MEEIYHGRYLRFLKDGRWEYVERVNSKGVAVIFAQTPQGKILFVEQYRLPVRHKVIELPAGLTNDTAESQHETAQEAAKRELLEETGYRAESMRELVRGPISAGLTSEQVTFFRAENLKKQHNGGGDETEAITVHEVLPSRANAWLLGMQKKGCLIDPKVYVGLYLGLPRS